MFAESKNEDPEASNSNLSRLKNGNKFLLHGIAASLLLTLAYFVIVSLAESFDHAIAQFLSLSYLMIPLITGFGVQVSLFSYSRQLSKVMRQGSVSVTASGGVSTASMIACCVHHLSDVVPLLGLTALGLFLTAYQAVFILIGVLSNVIGILTILASMQKHRLYDPRGFFAKPMHLNMTRTRNVALILALAIVIGSFALVALTSPPNTNMNNTGRFVLPAKTVVQNGLTIQVTPSPFAYGEEVKFSIALNTHSGALSFDLTKVATLQDSNGTNYMPTAWSGTPPGGHHMEGTLTFPALNDEPSSMKLVLTGVYGTDWIFEWTLTS